MKCIFFFLAFIYINETFSQTKKHLVKDIFNQSVFVFNGKVIKKEYLEEFPLKKEITGNKLVDSIQNSPEIFLKVTFLSHKCYKGSIANDTIIIYQDNDANGLAGRLFVINNNYNVYCVLSESVFMTDDMPYYKWFLHTNQHLQTFLPLEEETAILEKLKSESSNSYHYILKRELEKKD
jgi:hypothetical protein